MNQQPDEHFKFKTSSDIITVDPKVMEPNDPIPGRVPRKVNFASRKRAGII